MLLTLAQKHHRRGILLLCGLSGLALGVFCSSLAGYLLQPPPEIGTVPAPQQTVRQRPPSLLDFQPILTRDIFNPDGGNLRFSTTDNKRQTATSTAAPTPRVSWQLVGTVSGAPRPLAILRGNGKTHTWRLGDRLPDGSRLFRITRSQVVLALPDGNKATLTLPKKGTAPAAGRRQSTGGTGRRNRTIGAGIRQLDGNRWLIPRTEAERARSNIGQLIRQARVEPNLVDGRTNGFVVRMIQPGSLLARLGLRVGDILHRINDIPLDSPEKALQIMQQLRQARKIDLDVERGGKKLTFSYQID